MFKKKCSGCGYVLDRQWNFCPNCGLPPNGKNVSPGNLNIDLNKMMQQMIGPIMNSVIGGGLFQNQPLPKQKGNMQDKLNKNVGNVNEVVEPEDLVSDHSDTTVHAVSLPGVKSKSDISVMKMENSIEVRAISGKRLYLKIIKRDKGEGIISEQFTKDSLILVLKKV